MLILGSRVGGFESQHHAIARAIGHTRIVLPFRTSGEDRREIVIKAIVFAIEKLGHDLEPVVVIGVRIACPVFLDAWEDDGVFVIVAIVLMTDTHLLEIAQTLGVIGGFTRAAQGRQQDGNEQTDDGDDHQQFNQCESTESIGHDRFLSFKSVSL